MPITFARKSINTQELEAALKAAFGNRYTGLSTDVEFIHLYISNPVIEDIETAAAIYANHIPSETDDAADARKRRTIDDAIAALRAVNFDDVDTVAEIRNVLRLMRFIIVRD